MKRTKVKFVDPIILFIKIIFTRYFIHVLKKKNYIYEITKELFLFEKKKRNTF